MKTIATYLSVSFLAVILLFGCSNKSKENNEKQNRAIAFSVNPEIVSKTDSIQITFPESHPSKLSVITPDGQLYIIHSEEDLIEFLPYEEFKDAKSIEIPIATVKGTTWIDGKKSDLLVFDKKGKYSIYMADNLETEPDNTFNFKKDIELK